MKKFMNRFLYPSKKDFLLFTAIQIVCVTVLWFISETRANYFVAGFFSLTAFSTSFAMWGRIKWNSDIIR